jgi:hypothetical protein
MELAPGFWQDSCLRGDTASSHAAAANWFCDTLGFGYDRFWGRATGILHGPPGRRDMLPNHTVEAARAD